MSTLPISSDTSKQTLDTLWTRVRQRGDLPGFSKVVGAILGAMRGEDDSEFNMTKTVLSDPALTQKVLRLANSPMYSVFGNGINTVSKAVIVLGTEAIGHLALGLKLIDGLANASAESANARVEMGKAVLAGHIARQVASTASMRDTEEAMVCAMLHTLGRMMVSFYLSDRWTLVQERCAQGPLTEVEAAHEVLGLGLDEIGRAIAQQWGFPTSLVSSLREVQPRPAGEPLNHADWLAAISTMSSRCAAVLHVDDRAAAPQLSDIAGNYADMLGLDLSQLLAAVDAAQTAAEQEAIYVRPSKYADASKGSAARTGKPADAAQILARGVADMRGAAGVISSAQLLTMALETTFQGLGVSRAIVFLHNREEEKYSARMCFGEDVQELLRRLAFSDAYQPDVFHAALANDKMIFVEHAQDRNFISKLPDWWRNVFPGTRSFVVLPLKVNRQPAGFIYGDWDQSLPPVKIEAAEIPLLNEMRSLIERAIEHCHRLDVAGTRSTP